MVASLQGEQGQLKTKSDCSATDYSICLHNLGCDVRNYEAHTQNRLGYVRNYACQLIDSCNYDRRPKQTHMSAQKKVNLRAHLQNISKSATTDTTSVGVTLQCYQALSNDASGQQQHCQDQQVQAESDHLNNKVERKEKNTLLSATKEKLIVKLSFHMALASVKEVGEGCNNKVLASPSVATCGHYASYSKSVGHERCPYCCIAIKEQASKLPQLP